MIRWRDLNPHLSVLRLQPIACTISAAPYSYSVYTELSDWQDSHLHTPAYVQAIYMIEIYSQIKFGVEGSRLQSALKAINPSYTHPNILKNNRR